MSWLGGRKDKTGPGVVVPTASADTADSAVKKKSASPTSSPSAAAVRHVYEGFDPLIQAKGRDQDRARDRHSRSARGLPEAQLAGRLQRPDITTIYEFGSRTTSRSRARVPDGHDLDKVITAGTPLPVGGGRRYVLGIALGLDYAHRSASSTATSSRRVRVLRRKHDQIMRFRNRGGAGRSLRDRPGPGMASRFRGLPEPRADLREIPWITGRTLFLGASRTSSFSCRKAFEREPLRAPRDDRQEEPGAASIAARRSFHGARRDRPQDPAQDPAKRFPGGRRGSFVTR